MGGGQKNSAVVVLGAQWGDEGKGKLVDLLGREMSVVVRCAGGNNAGHTVVHAGKTYDFHLLPCGIMHPQCTAVIGQGVVIHLPGLFAEIEKNGIEDWASRLIISDRAHLVLNVHQAVDGLEEGRAKGGAKIGTTKKGIGPAYASKAWRNGLRLGKLMRKPDEFAEAFHSLVAHYRRLFPALELDEAAELKQLMEYRQRLLELSIVRNTQVFLLNQLRKGASVLVEGANGALLDIDHGTYPFVTSSSCCVGGVSTGLGLPPSLIGDVIGVAKAYQTRVGAGPMPTELSEKEAAELRDLGGEFGVTTGRARRCGHLDLFLLRYSAWTNGFSKIALTKLDILDTFTELKVAVGYSLDGEALEAPPSEVEDWERLVVEYRTLPGWRTSTKAARSFDELPSQAQDYVRLVESFTGVPVAWIGVGKARDEIILRSSS